MPDALDAALSHPGLGWLLGAALIAGLVRGFSGFGTALIYMPVAAQVLDPVWAIVTVLVLDLAGPLPNLPVAARSANWRDLSWLWLGTLLLLPVGLMVLIRVDPSVFRIAVGVVALVTVASLALGLRYRGSPGPGPVIGTGGLAGFLGGVSGIPGPPVILLYMAGAHPAAVIRASTMIYLFGYDLLLGAMLGIKGILSAVPVAIGVLLAVPNVAGTAIGAALFRPGRERVYRGVAYAIIAASALSALVRN